jgi:kynurenine 3-monooxygenase
MKIAIPMKGRMMHSVDGKLTFQPYSKDPKDCIYSISRGDLNCKLMTLAEQRAGN